MYTIFNKACIRNVTIFMICIQNVGCTNRVVYETSCTLMLLNYIDLSVCTVVDVRNGCVACTLQGPVYVCVIVNVNLC